MAQRSSSKRPFAAPALNRPGKLQKLAPPRRAPRPRPPPLTGPIHDAVHIENIHRQHVPARPPPKPSLLGNPKSPVANLAAALAIPLNYQFVDLFDTAANRQIVRSVLSPSPLLPLTSPTAVPSSSTPSLKSPP